VNGNDELFLLQVAVLSHVGFYEFNRLPFGLVNIPVTYQTLMEEVLGNLHLDICFIYLDDLIIFSKTYEDHLPVVDPRFMML
jgi:hypothetical protein